MWQHLKIAINIYYKPTNELKDIIISNSDIYVPINGGSGLKNDVWSKQNILFDDVGENISSKNSILNEMTSIYWIWKNYIRFGNPTYIGHNHYRRLFKRNDFLDYSDYDLIISKPIFSSNIVSLWLQYQNYHIISDLYTCIAIIKQYDSVFANQFFEYLNSTGINFAPCNMFIMKKELFFEWCEFIFPILFDLEKVIDLTGRDNYQKRALCFLTERIFGFWCHKKLTTHAIKEINMIEKLEFKPIGINERGTYG